VSPSPDGERMAVMETRLGTVEREQDKLRAAMANVAASHQLMKDDVQELKGAMAGLSADVAQVRAEMAKAQGDMATELKATRRELGVAAAAVIGQAAVAKGHGARMKKLERRVLGWGGLLVLVGDAGLLLAIRMLASGGAP